MKKEVAKFIKHLIDQHESCSDKQIRMERKIAILAFVDGYVTAILEE